MNNVMRLLRPIRVAVFLCFCVIGSTASAVTTSIEQDGIKIDFNIQAIDPGLQQLTANTDAEVSFSITDVSGSPLAGAYPAAWMQRRAESQPTDHVGCKKMIKTFIEGSLITQSSINLNVYYVLVLNDDASISVVNPLFQFGRTNLLTMIPLSGKGYDWQYAKQAQNLLVTIPDSQAVAVIDALSFKVREEIALAVTPGAIALQPDQRYAWIGYQGGDGQGDSGGVLVLDPESMEIVARLPGGRGMHQFAFSPDSRYVFVTNRKDDNVSIYDVRTLSLVKSVASGKQPVSIDYSSAADAVYISHTNGNVVAINVQSLKQTATVTLTRGLGQIRFAPGGRYALVVNPLNDFVYVIDTLNNSEIKSGKMDTGPDHIVFSDTLAYIRHQGSPTVLMIPLEIIADPNTELQTADFPGGQRPFGVADSPAAGIVQAPGENAVLVAHPKDQQIYYYKEGAAAPMGSFVNFQRSARAVIVLDRSLKEKSTGEYATTARLSEAGTYDVALFMDSPRVTHCFEIRVAPDSTSLENQFTQITLRLLAGQQIHAGKTARLRFNVLNDQNGKSISNVNEMQALAVLAPGFWQTRASVINEGEGVYAFEWTPPKAGAYFVQILSPWEKMKLSPPANMMLRVEE